MANNKMLIDCSHPEETRVVVLKGNKVEEFDFESASKKQLRGNIYLAKVTRVEPSLQAAFVDYGGNRHGFLAFSEIHPDYYQIPVADRQALLAAEAAAMEDEHDDEPVSDDGDDDASSTDDAAADAQPDDNDVEVAAASDADAPAAEDNPENSDSTSDDSSSETSVETDEASDPDDDKSGPAMAARSKKSDSVSAEVGSVEPETSGEPAASEEAPASENASADDNNSADAETTEAPAKRRRTRRPRKPKAAPDETASGEEAAADPAESVEATEGEAASETPSTAETSDDDAETQKPKRRRRGQRGRRGGKSRPTSDRESESDDDVNDDESVENVGAEDVLEEVSERRKPRPRQYKIQEVIKRRQVLLVQVVKEERGNKGAALTTYLSLAGRYSVLMPNTARGGGISRKITNVSDRKRLKGIASKLDVPTGMGVILRTAGASRTENEITRDFDYLSRLWETIRDHTLKSSAPTLVYEEGSLIKRTIRDLYSKEIDEIQVAGDAGHQEARDFMQMLMPEHTDHVQKYTAATPLFTQTGVETQLDALFSPEVTMKSGGYIVINQTEALVSIDVNSGRSTREHSIEDTALQTNLEAAEEVARQLRLRDLAGLVVIDFIDMEEKKNNRAVERRIKDCLRMDRARIQLGRISHFGLLEMSRQRLRTGVLEGSTIPCPQCHGTGSIRSTDSVALHVLRALEDYLQRNKGKHHITVRTRGGVALYMLNQKRAHLSDIEQRMGIDIIVEVDDNLGHELYALDRGESVNDRGDRKRSSVQPDSVDFSGDNDGEAGEEEKSGRRKRKRRRKGKSDQSGHAGTPSDGSADSNSADNAGDVATDSGPITQVAVDPTDETGEAPPKAKRSRGRRGSRSRSKPEADVAAANDSQATPTAESPVPSAAIAEDSSAPETPAAEPSSTPSIDVVVADIAPDPQPEMEPEVEPTAPAPAPIVQAEPVVVSTGKAEEDKPKRTGWWRR